MPQKIPSYRHRKSRNLAVVTLDGKDIYLGRYDSLESKEEYRRVVAEWLAAGRVKHPSTTPTEALTVAELILAFWDHAKGHYRHADGSETGELWNLRVALRPLKKLYSRTYAKDFGPLALRAVRDEMVKDGLARTSVNARINRIRLAFKWASSVELIPVTVSMALATVQGLQKGRTTARETEPIGPVALEVVEATLPFLTRPVAGMVRLMLLTGMRPGEAASIRGCDLTTGDGTWTYRPGSHKTEHRGKARVIPLGPKAVEVVRDFPKPDLDAYLFDPREAVPSRGKGRKGKSASRYGPRYSRYSLISAIKKACARAFPHPSIKKKRGKPLSAEDAATVEAWRKAHAWHPNQLRHTVATDIRARYGLEAAQVVLGHSKPDTTTIYAERDMAKARDVMREIG